MKINNFYFKTLKFVSFLPIYLLCLNFFVIFLNLNEYDFLALIDHDEGFLIEQLVLKINFFDVNRVISRFNEYGVEFYYLSYFFNFLLLFFDLSKIDIYHFTIFIHLIFSCLSFFLIFKIFSKLKLNIFYYLIFSFIIVSSPEFIYNSISLKPDLNILLFFYVLQCIFL